jgi:hypothetical protein
MQLFELLTKRGWIGRIDAVFAVLTVITPILLHWRYSDMAPLYLLLSMMAMMQVWLIVLAYRVAYFAVIIQVSLDNMPATSARLAVRFLKGGTSSSVPSGA